MSRSSPPLSKTNYIDLLHGQFHGTKPENLDKLFKALNQSGLNHLVVHFHGGLVSQKDALTEAKNLKDAYVLGGAYPVFFIWNSSLLSDLRIAIHKRTKQRLFVHLVQRILGYSVNNSSSRLKKGGMPGTLPELEKWAQKKECEGEFASTPLTTRERALIEDELAKDPVLIRDLHRILAEKSGLNCPFPELRNLLIQGHMNGISDARVLARLVIPVIDMVRRRFQDHRDHGLYTTVLEEVLVQVVRLDLDVIIPTWNQMKQDTDSAFIQNPSKYGGWAFLKHLQKWWQPKLKPGQRITLIGHSAGAIYIGNFLAAAQQVIPLLKVDVVFLAPACSYAFLNENLQAFKKQVTHLRMFALKGEVERGYWEVQGIYLGSLLYIISSLCESANKVNEEDVPLLGMQRYYDAQGPYKGIRAIPNVTDWLAKNSGPDLVWTPTGSASPGRESAAKKHGDFSTDKPTLKSLTHILSHGY